MYKNQLQELAQRSCFNLPSYSCIRQGPDHAPRFKACVNFNGEIFESPNYCTTLRQAEHSAAEVALNVLSTRGPSRSLTARVLDETGIYKNLLQETAHRAGLRLPVYTSVRSGPGHVPTFTCSVELAGMNFTGEAAKTKKQAEKNAAIAAWSALKKNLGSVANKEAETSGDQEEQEQAVVTRLLSNFSVSSKEEHSRQLRRRSDHQSQAASYRRRMVRGTQNHRDTSTTTTTNWRLIDDLLTDLVPQVSQKHSSFASLLPPPPPRMESKILPPTATLNRLDNSSSSYYTSSTYKKEGHSQSHSGTSCYSSSSSNSNCAYSCRQFPIKAAAATCASSSSLLARRSMYTQGHRVAPAVQIRSVIPVCAAPPVAVRPSNPPPIARMQDTSTSSQSALALKESDST